MWSLGSEIRCLPICVCVCVCVWIGRVEGESEGRDDGIPKSKLSGSQAVNQRLWNQRSPIEWSNRFSPENLEFRLAIYLPVKQSLFKRRPWWLSGMEGIPLAGGELGQQRDCTVAPWQDRLLSCCPVHLVICPRFAAHAATLMARAMCSLFHPHDLPCLVASTVGATRA